MTYPPQLGPLDQPGTLNGDRVWRGIEARLAGHAVSPGYGTAAVNCRFDQGVPETRPGLIRPRWANATPVPAPATDADEADWNTGEDLPGVTTDTEGGTASTWKPLLGWCWFTDPYTHGDYLLIATKAGVYWTAPNTIGGTVALPAGVTLDAPVEFTQSFNVVVLWRSNGTPLIMEQIDKGFRHPATPSLGDGTIAMPAAPWAVVLGNRLFSTDGADGLLGSEYLDYLRYLPGLSQLNFNAGTSDKLVAAAPFNDATLIAFKTQSIHAATNLGPDLTTAAQTEITREYGLVGRKAVARVGSDLWFLSRQGVMSLRQTEQQKIQGDAVPKSYPIQKLIARIHWAAAGKSIMVNYDRKIFLAVPMDGATDCNRILVHDLVTGAWCGYDEIDGVEFFDLKVITDAGRERLLVATTAGVILQYDESAYEDATPTPIVLDSAKHQGIAWSFTTREYVPEEGGRQTAQHLWYDVQHWAPTLTVTATATGLFNAQDIETNWVPSPTKYRENPDLDDWDATNVNGDFETAGRGDYAVLLGPDGFHFATGAAIDLHQETNRETELTVRGRAFTLQFQNTTGRARLLAVRVASVETPYRDGTL